jgi:hypothetical protein
MLLCLLDMYKKKKHKDAFFSLFFESYSSAFLLPSRVIKDDMNKSIV